MTAVVEDARSLEHAGSEGVDDDEVAAAVTAVLGAGELAWEAFAELDDDLAVSAPREVAFEPFVLRYQPLVWRIARRYLRDPQFATQVMQEAFLQMWLRWDPTQSPVHRRASLVTVTRHVAVDVLRSRDFKQREQTELWDLAELDERGAAVAGPEEDVVRGEEINSVREALRGLPDDQRWLIVNRFYYGTPFPQLAEQAATTEDAMRQRAARVLAKLRRQLAHVAGSLVPSVLRRPSWRQSPTVGGAAVAAQTVLFSLVLTSLTAAPPATAFAPRRDPVWVAGSPVEWTRPPVRRPEVAAAPSTPRDRRPQRRSTVVGTPSRTAHRPLVPMRIPALHPTTPTPPVLACEGRPGDELTVSVPMVEVSKCVAQNWVPVCEIVPVNTPLATCEHVGDPASAEPVLLRPGAG
ncbi:MAG TPA: sigma-70 family RNA polymerase sigma factor [Mycobacteriales bacterium]|nr:sigma-70 family RNA polymerase sigma factor [Mycobacteriales bacterium]